MSGADWAILVVVLVLFILSIFFAAAETAFVRMNRIRAIALEEEGNKRAHRLVVMLEHPEQTLNVVLLMVLVSQLTSATLIGVLLEGTAGTLGVVIGIVLQIVLFFVIQEIPLSVCGPIQKGPRMTRIADIQTPAGRKERGDDCRREGSFLRKVRELLIEQPHEFRLI